MTKPFELPPHLHSINRLVVDETVQDTPIFQRVTERLPDLTPEILPEGSAPDTLGINETGHTLYLKEYKGRFLRFCPGTSHYRCCAYRIIHIGENCPLACSYCILQAYFQDRVLKVWANQDALFSELGNAFNADRSKRYRVGTGEFTDSLALEALTDYSADLIEFLNDHENVVLELKSKVIDLSWLKRCKDPRRILPAWSLNAPFIHEHEEFGTATLDERLQAARTCADAGHRVCLHFDPIIRYPGWEEGYADIIDRIFDYLKPEEIAYMSMGSFRHMPVLKKHIEDNFPDTTYIYDEFIPGLDNKMRLLRPKRLEQFKAIVKRLRGHGMDRQLYFCMESDDVWTEVMGYTPKDLGGLANHLMAQAFND